MPSLASAGEVAKWDQSLIQRLPLLQGMALPAIVIAEVRRGLTAAAGRPVGLTFVPHLANDPWHYATLYARLLREVDPGALRAAL
jgi:hypothetical protein